MSDNQVNNNTVVTVERQSGTAESSNTSSAVVNNSSTHIKFGIFKYSILDVLQLRLVAPQVSKPKKVFN